MTDGVLPADIRVRLATPADQAAVANVLDGAALALDHEQLPGAIERGDVLVAEGVAEAATDSIVGALVLDGREITAVAVRRRRRGQGIGTALVVAAAERREILVAEFDEAIRAFWESVGFTVTSRPDSTRCRGVR